MARFYADIVSDNGRTETSRIGRRSISAHPRSWTTGVLAHLWPITANAPSDANNISISVTGGSGYRSNSFHLAQILEKDGQRMLTIFNPETSQVLWEGYV